MTVTTLYRSRHNSLCVRIERALIKQGLKILKCIYTHSVWPRIFNYFQNVFLLRKIELI